MKDEHTNCGSESTDEFITGNYGIKTSSKVEWSFVINDQVTSDQVGLARWPEEAVEKLRDRSHCRKQRPLADILKAAESRNEQLEKANHTPLIRVCA